MSKVDVWQEVICNLEEIYNRKINKWDLSSYKEICRDVREIDLIPFFMGFIQSRKNNFFFVPEDLRQYKLKNYTVVIPEKVKKKQVKYDDCHRCYQTGFIWCKERRIKTDHFDAYNVSFLCKCNNIEKLSGEDIRGKVYFHEDYLKRYTPVNFFIDKKYNGNYSQYNKDLFQHTMNNLISRNTEAAQELRENTKSKGKMINLFEGADKYFTSKELKKLDEKGESVKNIVNK